MPYRFAYDGSDRLIKEVRVDNLTRRFTYNDGGHLTRLDEIGPTGWFGRRRRLTVSWKAPARIAMTAWGDGLPSSRRSMALPSRSISLARITDAARGDAGAEHYVFLRAG